MSTTAEDPSLPPSANLNNREMSHPSPLIRLLPHTIDSLPPHPAFAPTISAQTHGDAPQDPNRLLHFAHTLLSEAVAFTDTYLPQAFRPKASNKSSPPAAAKVDLLEHIRTQHGNEETWFARRSRHADAADPGTATFAEMDAGLRREHSVHEMQYTPDVFDAYEVVSWDAELEKILASSSAAAAEAPGTASATPFTEISMRIYEMCHALPTPLQPRVFSVLVASARTPPSPSSSATSSSPSGSNDDNDKGGFVVVQIPIDIASVPAAFYSNGRHVKEGTSPEKRKDVVVGIYTSIERGRYVVSDNTKEEEEGGQGQGQGQGAEGEKGRGETEWVMATASDARGALPMWMQRMGTPGAVVKDVGFFMKWVQERR